MPVSPMLESIFWWLYQHVTYIAWQLDPLVNGTGPFGGGGGGSW